MIRARLRPKPTPLYTSLSPLMARAAPQPMPFFAHSCLRHAQGLIDHMHANKLRLSHVKKLAVGALCSLCKGFGF